MDLGNLVNPAFHQQCQTFPAGQPLMTTQVATTPFLQNFIGVGQQPNGLFEIPILFGNQQAQAQPIYPSIQQLVQFVIP